jgi:hypothetical protein
VEESNATISIFSAKDQNAWKNPLDVKRSQVKWKTIHEPIGAIHRRVYSSNDEEEESDFPEDSNKVEVKEDIHYKRD